MAFWNRKKNTPEAEHPTPSNVQMNNSLFRDITQNVAMLMCSAKITKEPVLKFFYSDGGICEGMFFQHTTDPDILALKRQSPDDYLFVVGMHAFGAGVYVTCMQQKFKKPVDEFGTTEFEKIVRALKETDAYELALNTLGISLESANKRVLDQIILIARDTVQSTCGSKVFEAENIRTYMQVLFNAGITMVMRG